MSQTINKRNRGGSRPKSGDADWMEDVQFVRDTKNGGSWPSDKTSI